MKADNFITNRHTIRYILVFKKLQFVGFRFNAYIINFGISVLKQKFEKLTFFLIIKESNSAIEMILYYTTTWKHCIAVLFLIISRKNN